MYDTLKELHYRLAITSCRVRVEIMPKDPLSDEETEGLVKSQELGAKFRVLCKFKRKLAGLHRKTKESMQES